MPGRRPPLTRERILETALALADENGVHAITMRRLGDELGYEAMSLYRHVESKDDMLDGILDLVLAETENPTLDEPWDDAIRRSALSVHAALERHPWATRLLMIPPRVRQRRVEYMDALLGCLRNAGFSAETTYTAYHVIDAYIYGFSLWLSTYERAQLSDEQVAQLLQIGGRTLSRARGANRKRLPADVSERLFAVASVYAFAIGVFGNTQTAFGWINEPQFGFAGRTPFDLISSELGRRQVTSLLQRIEHGMLA